MAYNTKKGSQHSGDIQYEGDPNDVQIDFESDEVSLMAGGVKRLTANSSSVSVSGSLTGSNALFAPTVQANLMYSTVGLYVAPGTSNESKFLATGVSGSGTFQTVGAATFGSTLNVTGTATLGSQLLVSQLISGSSLLQAVGATTLGSTLNVSGNTIIGGQISGSSNLQAGGATTLESTLNVSGNSVFAGALSSSSTLEVVGRIVTNNIIFATGSIRTAAYVTSSQGYQGRDLDIGGQSEFKVDSVGVLSSSSTINAVGSISSSANLAVTGAVHAANFYGDGGGITGLTVPVANYNNAADNRIITSVDSDTIQGEANLTFDGNDLKVISANISSSGGQLIIHDAGASAAIVTDGGLNVSGATNFGDGNGADALTVDTGGWDSGGAYSISGSGRIRGYSMHAGNNQISLGNDEGAVYWPAGEAYIINQGHYSGSKSLVVGGPISGSGTLFMSGAISGAAGLQAVGATTFGNTMAVTGNVNIGGPNQANGRLYVKGEDSAVVAIFKSDSHDTILAMTGSGQVVIGGMHLAAKLNASGSDVDKIISAAATSRGETFYISGSGEAFNSGSLILQDVEPNIYFSGSDGSTILGQIGYNSSDNILIQNNVVNKHIVLKANDAGTLREGFRLDGAVPEVVVNQTADSLVDFRVESDNNTHMLFVDGANDKVGINTDSPGTTLDINGNAIRIRSNSTPASAGALGMAGEIRWDSNYIYICIATDTWRRIAHSTW